MRHFCICNIARNSWKWCSRIPVTDTYGIVDISDLLQSRQQEQEDDPDKPWCYYSEPGYGEMVCCDNKACTIHWFHYHCLHLKNAPKGKW